MQSAYIEGTTQKVLAINADTLNGDKFVCTGCGSTMYLKNGMVRVAHFAHAPDSYCAFNRSESEEQVLYKNSIYNALKERYAPKSAVVDLEYTGFFGCRPDVFIIGKKSKIAIEVLVDATDVRDIINRSESYFEVNVGVIWVLPYDSARMIVGEFKMKEHEKLLYFMNNKRLVFWNRSKSAFAVAEFSPLYSEGSEFYDKDQGSMVYYSGKRLRSTFQIKRIFNDVYLENFKRWVSSKRFEMKTYKYPLPKSILWKYQSEKSKQ
ncbi:competence protein CoiA family protein [Mucilaginibacter sp.]